MASAASQQQAVNINNTANANAPKAATVRENEPITHGQRDFIRALASTTFKVYRVIIGMHSQYFKRLCEGAFWESGERKVILHDDSVAAVRAMVDWLYTSDYETPIVDTSAGEGTDPRCLLEAHAHVFVLANKYDIQALKDAAVQAFCDRVQDKQGKYDAAFFSTRADEFVIATPYIYKNVAPAYRGLRWIVMGFWSFEKILYQHVKKEEIDALVADVPEFASDLIAQTKDVRIGEEREHV